MISKTKKTVKHGVKIMTLTNVKWYGQQQLKWLQKLFQTLVIGDK